MGQQIEVLRNIKDRLCSRYEPEATNPTCINPRAGGGSKKYSIAEAGGSLRPDQLGVSVARSFAIPQSQNGPIMKIVRTVPTIL